MYSEKIYNYIFSKTFDREMAEDLTSETFFKALDKIKSFKM
jgi:DNA-directed RNA polymerase specialized sigma24 family protein